MVDLDKQFPFIKKIPHTQGDHGHGKYQKKLWRVVSDTVRIRDFYKYRKCIACVRFIPNWKYLQAGHYRAWSVCNGFSKWDMSNIFGECPICNTGFNGNEVGAKFKEGILSRYGQKRIDYIDTMRKYPSEKMDDFKCVLLTKEILKEMKDLPEQPEYWKNANDFI